MRGETTRCPHSRPGSARPRQRAFQRLPLRPCALRAAHPEGVLVVHPVDGAEPILAGNVPELERHLRPPDLELPEVKVHADGRPVEVAETVRNGALNDGRLARGRVTKDEHLQDDLAGSGAFHPGRFLTGEKPRLATPTCQAGVPIPELKRKLSARLWSRTGRRSTVDNWNYAIKCP